MNMKLYYVVRPVEFGGRDVQYFAGPFPSKEEAYEVVDKIIGRHDYFVVTQAVTVNV